jgi:hypothetical protein
MNFSENLDKQLFELILRNGSTKFILHCLEYGANVNYVRHHISYYGYSCLMIAIYVLNKNNYDKYKFIIGKLIEYGADVNIKINHVENANSYDIGDISALILAIENKDVDISIIKMLLDKGANTSLIYNGKTIEILAYGRKDVLDLLNGYKYNYSEQDIAIIDNILHGKYTYKWFDVEELKLKHPHITYGMEQAYRIRNQMEKLKLESQILTEGFLIL